MASKNTDDIRPALEEVRLPMVEKVVKSLVPSIRNKLQMMAYDTVCIYRVSEKHRKINEEAYTPRSVSIGPIHHGKSQLQAMESYKLRCLKCFISRAGTTDEMLISFAAKEEISVRGCYEDTVLISSENFSEMILLDGVFILELLLNNWFRHMREPSEGVLADNTWMAALFYKWMADDVLHDMLLLENQLPINFLTGLFSFVEGSLVDNISFFQLASEYFKNVGNTGRLQLTKKCERARHFVEFLVYLHQPSREKEDLHFRNFEYTRSASELQAAGVKFTPGKENCLFDVSFNTAVGVLKIPPLLVNDFSETFFRNLIAFEECGHYSKGSTSYIIFMDSLINTSNDVDLLVKNGIIENLLGESQQVADLFNNIYKEVPDQRQFYYAQICGDLDKYSKDYLHEWKSTWFKWKVSTWFKWKVILRRDYFNNPWSVTALVVAFVLLGLTVIQTVCTIIQTV